MDTKEGHLDALGVQGGAVEDLGWQGGAVVAFHLGKAHRRGR